MNGLRKNRIQPCWQTLKLILSSLIVFNFYLGLPFTIKYDFSLLLNIFDKTLIPMIIFITGYTSKDITWDSLRHHLTPAVITYVTFQTIDSIPHYLSGTLTLNSYLLFPQNGVWFFLAIPIWQFIFLLLTPIKNSGLWLFVILITSLIFGFLVNYFLIKTSTLFSIVNYFPFFIMAYFCNEIKLSRIRNQYFIVVLSIITLTIYCLNYQSDINYHLVSKLGFSVFTDNFISYIINFLVGIALGIICIYAASSSVSVLLAKISTNATGIFLTHPIICFSLLKSVELLGIKTDLLSVIILTLTTVIISILLAMTPFINWLISPTLRSATLIDNTHRNT